MAGKKIVVLGVNGSPRKYGGVSSLLRVALKAAEKEGAETRLIHLCDYRIEPCAGCLSDVQEACKPPCVFEDEMRKLYGAVMEAHGIILATPIYWYAPSGLMKNFIDRLTVFENMIMLGDKSWLEGKVVGAIAVGNDSGEIMTISYLLVTMNSMGALVPPWALAYSRMGDRALEDESAVRDAANLGAIIARAAKIIVERGPQEWYKSEPPWLEEIVESVEKEIAEEKERQLPVRKNLIEKILREKPRV